MGQVKEGDVVKVHYTGKLVNGEQFDSSVGREPLEFTVGAGMMIKGFDAAMPGMVIGEKKTINIAPEDGYGEKSAEAIIEFPKENIIRKIKTIFFATCFVCDIKFIICYLWGRAHYNIKNYFK